MAEYTTISVSAGDTYTVSLGDGDTFENYLIDITASGANYDIQCDGSGWAFRNVGVVGTFSGGHTEPFRARVPDSSGTATIENVYMADGNADSNATGLYVYWDHAGHLDINQCNFQHWTDNAIYASGPGNPDNHSLPGSHGTVHITNSYSKYNDKSNFRLGTDGSKVENCVAGGGSQRGHWQFYNNSDVIDCHIDDGIALGDAVWDNNASVDCTDSYWDEEIAHGDESTSNINGTSLGTPQDFVPTGVPTAAEDAASATGGATGFALATRPAADITHDGVRLRGDVDALDASSATVWFDYRPQGTTTWRETATQSVSSSTNVEARVSGLSAATTYEFRLAGEDSAGTTATGATETVRTRSNADPVGEDFSAGDLAAYDGDTARFDVVTDVSPGGS